MGRVISVVSGKGGVGKTTVACSLALALEKQGLSVCLIDLDVGLNNIDVLLGVDSKVVYDIGDYLEGKCRLKQALINVSAFDGLYLLPSVRYKKGNESWVRSINEASEKLATVFDFILIDAPAGMGENFEKAIEISKESIVVVTPHIASIRDADKVISRLKAKDINAKVVVNRIRGDMVAQKEMLNHSQIEKLLKTQVIGVIPESDEINILSSIKFERVAKSDLIGVFNLITKNLREDKKLIYDYESKYKGFFGVVRRKLKRIV